MSYTISLERVRRGERIPWYLPRRKLWHVPTYEVGNWFDALRWLAEGAFFSWVRYCYNDLGMPYADEDLGRAVTFGEFLKAYWHWRWAGVEED